MREACASTIAYGRMVSTWLEVRVFFQTKGLRDEEHDLLVLPLGLEPKSSAPEADILSIELRKHRVKSQERKKTGLQSSSNWKRPKTGSKE
jgi:hypothetical protein